MTPMSNAAPKTIAELKDACNAIATASNAARHRSAALADARKYADALSGVSNEEWLTDADRACFASVNLAALYIALTAQEEEARADADRLADAFGDASAALNDAPEEAA